MILKTRVVHLPQCNSRSESRSDGRKQELRLPKPTGHEVILASLIKKREEVAVMLMSGVEFKGSISQFDKYTITFRVGSEGRLRTCYKHAIEYFEPLIAE
jgi:RNA chaperone Hfq